MNTVSNRAQSSLQISFLCEITFLHLIPYRLDIKRGTLDQIRMLTKLQLQNAVLLFGRIPTFRECPRYRWRWTSSAIILLSYIFHNKQNNHFTLSCYDKDSNIASKNLERFNNVHEQEFLIYNCKSCVLSVLRRRHIMFLQCRFYFS